MRTKRMILLLTTVLALSAAAYGFADSLSVGSDSLSAGQQVTASCQTGPMTVTYPVGSLTYDAAATGSGFKVTKVDVTGVAVGCVGKTASLELTKNGDGTALSSSSPVTMALGTTSFTISGVVDAKSVTGASLVITGS